MKNTIGSYYTRFHVINFVIVIGVILMIIYWSLASFVFQDVFNPLRDAYLYVSKFVFARINPNGELATEFSNPLDGDWISNINLAMGCFGTTIILIKCWVYLAFEVYTRLERSMMISKFGKKKYDSLQRYLKIKAANLKRQDSEKADIEKAEFAHYEKWKSYYKSSLSFDEWKEKVVNSSKT